MSTETNELANAIEGNSLTSDSRKRLLRTFVQRLVLFQVEAVLDNLYAAPGFQKSLAKSFTDGDEAPEKTELLEELESGIERALKFRFGK